MLDFKLQYYFELYKDTPIASTAKFKLAFTKKHGSFELLNELMIMIQKYQYHKYGDLISDGHNTTESRGNGERFKREMMRMRNRFGTKEERMKRKLKERGVL